MITRLDDYIGLITVPFILFMMFVFFVFFACLKTIFTFIEVMWYLGAQLVYGTAWCIGIVNVWISLIKR